MHSLADMYWLEALVNFFFFFLVTFCFLPRYDVIVVVVTVLRFCLCVAEPAYDTAICLFELMEQFEADRFSWTFLEYSLTTLRRDPWRDLPWQQHWWRAGFRKSAGFFIFLKSSLEFVQCLSQDLSSERIDRADLETGVAVIVLGRCLLGVTLL